MIEAISEKPFVNPLARKIQEILLTRKNLVVKILKLYLHARRASRIRETVEFLFFIVVLAKKIVYLRTRLSNEVIISLSWRLLENKRPHCRRGERMKLH